MAIGCMLLVLQPHVADFTFAANCMWACVCVCKGGEGGEEGGGVQVCVCILCARICM